MGYYSWYRQIGEYFYLSNMIFDDTIWIKLSENYKKFEIGSAAERIPIPLMEVLELRLACMYVY